MMRLYDTHFHLDLQKDRARAIREIEEHQIYTIAVTNLPDLYRREAGESESKFIRIGLGFHPELVHQYSSQIPLMWQLLSGTRYIGEVGLDYVDTTYQKEQKAFFSELIERCKDESQKILSIHSRKAVKDVLDIIGKDFKFKPILHWFTGNRQELIKAVDMGYYFSINSAMLASKRFLDMLPIIHSERLLLETDSPFTYFKASHSNTLKKCKSELESLKPGIDIWQNFRNILTQI